jgi:hypothetical protein
MTNNIRVFLWLGLALAVWLNYSQWQVDYGAKPVPPTAATTAADGSKPPSLDDTVPQAAQPSVPSTNSPPTAAPVQDTGQVATFERSAPCDSMASIA